MNKPNIILIMSDNQPADLLGCYGNDEAKTPHLNKIAQDGIRFDNAYCVNAMCSPCRASVLTGLMPSQHGVHNWLDDTLMDRWPHNWSAVGEYQNFPTLLKQAGYATALIGKYHLGVPYEPQLAFDHWVTFPHGHTASFYDNEVIDQEKRYRFEGHTVDFFTDKTVDYIHGRKNKPEPFFAFVPFNGPYGHWPSIKGRAENEFAELYDNSPMSSIPREGLDTKVLDRFGMRITDGGGQIREQFKGPLLLPNNVDSLRNYFSQVSLIDHGVGKIKNALSEQGLLENTIVIYTADHGFSLGHNGIWGHGLATWPATTHRPSFNIPLIMSGGPINQTNAVCDEMISQIDLFPTVLSLAGIQAKTSMTSSANDLSGYLAGENQRWPEAVYMEQEETRAVRTKDWLYMKRFSGAAKYPLSDAFYDLKKDPHEKHNLITLETHDSIKLELNQKIDDFFSQYSTREYDLWSGGSAKSNVSMANFWRDAWGESWATEFG
jgi:arylsulfatase A-like enzyme